MSYYLGYLAVRYDQALKDHRCYLSKSLESLPKDESAQAVRLDTIEHGGVASSKTRH